MSTYTATAAKIEFSTDGETWEDVTGICGPVEITTTYNIRDLYWLLAGVAPIEFLAIDHPNWKLKLSVSTIRRE